MLAELFGFGGACFADGLGEPHGDTVEVTGRHTGEVPGYSSWDYTDSAGRRTASVIVTTIFGIALPKAAGATQTLINAAVCTMFGKPIPAAAATG